MPEPRDPLASFRDEVVQALEAGLRSLGLDDAADEVPQRLEVPRDAHGDVAYPCFPLAGILRKAPHDIAAELGDALPPLELSAVDAAGPYLNFRYDAAALARATLGAVGELGEAYGTHAGRGESVVLEHTSANPNGPFHVGRARNPVVGDSLARVLRAAGYDVTTEYYVNDMGKQVAILTWGLRHLDPDDVPPVEREKPDHRRVVYYQAANALLEEDEDVAAEVNDLLHRFEAGDREVAEAFRETVESVLAGMRTSLHRMNVALDAWSFESTYVLGGEVDDVLARLRDCPYAGRDDDGARFLELESFGVQGRSTRWYFTRSDGTTLYTTRDLAYHRDKFQRADRVLNILGEDHKLTMQQLGIALNLIGVPRVPEVVWISFVNLPEGKMSTRRGRVVYLDDLLDEAVERARAEVEKRRGDELDDDAIEAIAEVVGIGAVRFNIARVQPEKGITFRWEDALNFDGASAPFCQYAHARCAGILDRAHGEGVEAGDGDAALLEHPSEAALVRAVAALPGVVAEAARDRKVHPLAEAAVTLANAFNAFYRDCPVLQAGDPALRDARLALVAATKQALRNALDLLGVVAPDSM